MGCLKLVYRQEEPTLKVVHRDLNISSKNCAGLYRYGYQGSEKENEYMNGEAYTTHFRLLNTQLGRWMSPDVITMPWQSPYVSMDNSPVALTDVMGAATDGGGGEGTRSQATSFLSQHLAGKSTPSTADANAGPPTANIVHGMIGVSAGEQSMPKPTIYKNTSGQQVSINDGLRETVTLSDTDFEEAQFFANELNEGSDDDVIKGVMSYDILLAYREFYNDHKSYDGYTYTNVYNMLFTKPYPNIASDPTAPMGSGGPGIVFEWIEGGPMTKGMLKQAMKQLPKLFRWNSHHIIPKAVFKKFKKALAPFMELNGRYNLKNLPTPFHGNHPQYNRVVGEKITQLGLDGNINAESLLELQLELRILLRDAYNSKKTINEYFRHL